MSSPSRREMHGARKPVQDRPPCLASDQSKLRWVVGDAFDRFVQRRAELQAKPGPPTFMPSLAFRVLRPQPQG